MFDVLAIGAANIDFFFHVKKLPSVDEEVDAFRIDKKLGGSAANFAVACSKLNLKTAFLGCLGKDKEGNELLASFQEAGVDVSNVQRVDARTGRFVTIVDEQGEKVMAAFVGSNNVLAEQMIEEKTIKNTCLVHLTSLSSEKAFKALLKAKRLAKENNMLVSLDPGHILAEKGLEKLKPLIDGIDLFFPSKKELEKITGEENVEVGCTKLKSLVKVVAVTLKKKGCFVSSTQESFLLPTTEKKALDSTGAGDAFAAAFIYGFLKKQELKKCALLANTAAGLAIQGKGARTTQVNECTLLHELKNKID